MNTDVCWEKQKKTTREGWLKCSFIKREAGLKQDEDDDGRKVKTEKKVRSLVYIAGAQWGDKPREQPLLNDAILPTLKDDSGWTEVTKRANNIHTWCGRAAWRVLGETQTWLQSLKTLILLAVSVSQVSSVQMHLSLRCPTDTSVQRCVCINTCIHVHVNHARLQYMFAKEWACSPEGRPVEPVTVFLSTYRQTLLSCCLHGFLTVWGAMYPPVPPQHTNRPG